MVHRDHEMNAGVNNTKQRVRTTTTNLAKNGVPCVIPPSPSTGQKLPLPSFVSELPPPPPSVLHAFITDSFRAHRALSQGVQRPICVLHAQLFTMPKNMLFVRLDKRHLPCRVCWSLRVHHIALKGTI